MYTIRITKRKDNQSDTHDEHLEAHTNHGYNRHIELLSFFHPHLTFYLLRIILGCNHIVEQRVYTWALSA